MSLLKPSTHAKCSNESDGRPLRVCSITLDEATQLAVLASFAGSLLEGMVEPAQDMVDLLNERFWDLI